MNKYSGRWTANIPVEERQDFEEYLSNSKKILDRLQEICYNMVNELDTKMSNYDNPNWPYMTADAIGQKKSLEKVINLLKPIQEKDHTTNGR